MTDEKHVLKATAATLLVSKLVHRLLDLVSIVGMFVAFLGAVARAGYDAGMWWKTAHTSGYTNAAASSSRCSAVRRSLGRPWYTRSSRRAHDTRPTYDPVVT